MRAVIQRVSEAKVVVNQKTVGQINQGYLVLLGITHNDSLEDVEWLVTKIIELRVFNDENGLMNKRLIEVDGNILLISQFTLMAQTKKGNRPSFIQAAKPAVAIPLYEAAINTFNKLLGKKIENGIFGADMQVSLTNNGPVTLIIDTKNKE
jgi:D-aminoacyl-tRNA deacylase